MSEHTATIEWRRGEASFEYREYPRNHTWTFENGLAVEASAAPAYLGDASKVDPEEAFVASLSACHMLTFLAMCAKHKLVLDRYQDRATGHLGKTEKGMVIARVELHPVATFADGVEVPREKLEELHQLAHKYCFIANSVTSEVVTVLD